MSDPIDPDNPIARRRNALRAQAATSAVAPPPAASDAVTTQLEPDPPLLPSMLQAFAHPFQGSAPFALLWIAFCTVATPYAAAIMETPFGAALVVLLLFLSPIALGTRSRPMLFVLTTFLFISIFMAAGVIEHPDLYLLVFLVLLWFFAAWISALMLRVIDDGAENRPRMSPLPGFGGGDLLEEVLIPGHLALATLIASYLPYLIYCFIAYGTVGNGPVMGLEGPLFGLLRIIASTSIFLAGPPQNGVLDWLLYLAGTAYYFPSLILVVRTRSLLGLQPRFWLAAVRVMTGSYLVVALGTVLVWQGSRWLGEQSLRYFDPFGDPGALFVKLLLLAWVVLAILVVLWRWLGLVFACNRTALVTALESSAETASS